MLRAFHPFLRDILLIYVKKPTKLWKAPIDTESRSARSRRGGEDIQFVDNSRLTLGVRSAARSVPSQMKGNDEPIETPA